jgi:hypothetical protein
MTGKSIVLTERDKAIVREVTRFGVLTRHQLMDLQFFRSKSRAKERLKRLVDAGYLTSRPQPLSAGGPQSVYASGPLIDDSRGARKRLTEVSDLFLVHELGLVDMHIAFERSTTVVRWITAKDLSALSFGVVPDAYVEFEQHGLTYCAFLEYDRGTETVSRFERKTRAYVGFARSGQFDRLFHRRFFRVLVVTDTLGRLTSLSKTTARVTDRVFRFTTRAALAREGPLQSIWRRPGVSTSESLTDP